jgi:hypothetical protein
VLILGFFAYVLDDVLDKFTEGAGDISLSLNLLIIVVVAVFLSSIKELKVLKWQTLFKMDWSYSWCWFRRFVVFNLAGYWIKPFIAGFVGSQEKQK